MVQSDGNRLAQPMNRGEKGLPYFRTYHLDHKLKSVVLADNDQSRRWSAGKHSAAWSEADLSALCEPHA